MVFGWDGFGYGWGVVYGVLLCLYWDGELSICNDLILYYICFKLYILKVYEKRIKYKKNRLFYVGKCFVIVL